MVLESDKIRRKIESCVDLPTLPTVATHILELANSPKTNAADVGKVIEQDQAITGKVLRLVNSAFYGFPGQIKTIPHAVVILGFNKVKNVVMTASVFDLSKGRRTNSLDMQRFWEHSLGCAIAAKIVAKRVGGGLQPDDAFVGGLMHDLGKLVFELTMPEEYGQAIAAAAERGILLLEAEKEILGVQHHQVGTWIAEKWHLPPALKHSLSSHHAPAQIREDREIVAAVHLADIFARALGIGSGGDKRIPAIDAALRQQYNLDAAFFDETLDTILAEIRRAKEFFELIGT